MTEVADQWAFRFTRSPGVVALAGLVEDGCCAVGPGEDDASLSTLSTLSHDCSVMPREQKPNSQIKGSAIIAKYAKLLVY